MFGLENQKKKKKVAEFVFELEKELMSTAKHNEIKQRVEGRVQSIKKILREGENKDEFDHFGQLLYGYTSLLKVMSRFSPKG